MMIFSQNEIMLMIGVVSVLLFCITILTILDIKDYLKAKKEQNSVLDEPVKVEEKELETINIMEVEDDDSLTVDSKTDAQNEVYLEEMDEENFESDSIINPIIEEEEMVVPQVVETNIEPQVSVDEKKDDILQISVDEEKRNVDVLEELEEIENSLPNEKDDVTNFEAEQERTAIISLDELMQKSNELYDGNEVSQYDDGNEPISIDEVIKMFKKDEKIEEIEEKPMPEVLQKAVEAKVPYSKKETIPFISSVYGIEKDNNALEFENTATYEKLDREKYNDFVSQLQEMNENK